MADLTQVVTEEEQRFRSADYWRRRYRRGGNSGSGSYGRLAQYKADYINQTVKKFGIQSVLELGSGDGNQASLFDFPNYTGVDISRIAVRNCRALFADRTGWQFKVAGREDNLPHDLTMSLDVIYHLVEDDVYNEYMHDLFDAARDYVLIYASDKEDRAPNKHVRHRRFSDWIAQNAEGWRLIDAPAHPYSYGEGKSAKNTSFASFTLYAKQANR